MKKLVILFWSVLFVLFATSCQDEIGDHIVKGEDISKFSITSPATSATININIGDPNGTFKFEWEAAESGLGSAIIYRILFDEEGGDFSDPLLAKAADDSGTSTFANISNTELAGIADLLLKSSAEEITVMWTVEASNGSDYIAYAQPASSIVLTVPEVGITPYTIENPVNKSFVEFSVVTGTEKIAFKWRSATASDDSQIKYKVLFDNLAGDFSVPLLTLDADQTGADTTITLTHQEWIDHFDAAGITSGAYKWTVQAYTEGIAIITNPLEIAIDIKKFPEHLYLVGSATSIDWDVANAIECTNGGDGLFTIITRLDADGEFKFVTHQQWPGGELDSKAIGYKDGEVSFDPSAGNFAGPEEEGQYKLTINFADMSWSVERFETMNIVGDATEPGWDIDNAVELEFIKNEMMWIGFVRLKSGAFKFFPQKGSWDNGLGLTGEEGVLGDGDNIPSPNTSTDFKLYRVTVNYDVDNSRYTYSVIPAEMFLVGDASPAGWNIDNGYHMLYNGDGKWITFVEMNASGGYKFFAETGNWNSGYKETATAGELTMEPGDPNISTPGAGYYKYVVDAYNMTYTADIVTQEMYIVGSVNGWDINNPTAMTYNGSGEWTLTVDLTDGDIFKIVPEKSWDLAFKIKDGELNAENGDPNITSPGTGNYTVTLNMWTKEFTFTEN